VFTGTGGGIAVGETYAGHAGQFGSIRSNIFWDTSERVYSVYDSGSDDSVSDLISAANLDYNGLFNILDGDNNGTNNLEFSTGTPNANSIFADPEFVDDSAD